MKAKRIDPYLIRNDQTVDLHGVRFPLEYLFRGGLVVGQPGSGKTRCILMPLLRSILQATGTDPDEKAGLIIADPKNEFGPFIAEIMRDMGREEDLVVLRPGAAYYNPLDSPFLTESETIEKIIAFANHTNRNAGGRGRGVEAYWENAQRNLLTAVVAATRTIHKGKLTFTTINETFRTINRFSNPGAAADWMRKHHLSEPSANGIRDFLSLPDSSTRPCVATSISGVLYCWQSEPLRSLITPQDQVPAIDPIDIVHRGKVLLVACSNAAFGVSISPLLVALKEHLFSTMLSRDQLEVCIGDDQWHLINQRRPIFFFADEFQSYLTPDASAGELVALDRLRSFKGGYIAATQNLASLHSVLGDAANATRLISLFSTQVFMSNICPLTATQAEHILGQKRSKERQTERSRILPAPLLFRRALSASKGNGGSVIETVRLAPRVTASTLAKMKTGEFWMRLASGEVFRRKAPPLIAPSTSLQF